MPEVILPCPACGSNDSECIFGEDEMYSVDCGNCAMRGPAERNPDAAIAAYNTLPRALTWTTEPPKVAGKYWWRPVGKKIGRIRDIFVRNGDAGFLDHNYRFIKDIGDGEWAGPIPTPLEPEES